MDYRLVNICVGSSHNPVSNEMKRPGTPKVHVLLFKKGLKTVQNQLIGKHSCWLFDDVDDYLMMLMIIW